MNTTEETVPKDEKMTAAWEAIRKTLAKQRPSDEPDDSLSRRLEDERTKRLVRRTVDAEELPPSSRTLPKAQTLAERLALPRRIVEWRIEGLQQVGHRTLVSSQYKSGKTSLIVNVVRSLADGEPFLDRFEVSPPTGRIAVVDFEMLGDEPGQLDDWYRDAGLKNPDRVVMVPMKGRAASFNVMDDAVLNAWAAWFKAASVSYLVVDCLRPALDAIGLDEKSEAGAFFVRFDQMLKEAGITEALWVHHMGHQSKNNTTERGRGDSRIMDWPDVNWTVVRQDPDDLNSTRFFRAFGRDVDVKETALEYNPTTRRMSLGGGEKQSRKDAKRGADDAMVLAVLPEHGSSEWKSGRKLFDVLPLGHSAIKKALLGLQAASKTGHKGATVWQKGCGDGLKTGCRKDHCAFKVDPSLLAKTVR